jgi:predicted DNA binding CopG/RHH family protein
MGCKRIIDGKTYNTDTATLVHELCANPTGEQYEGLYQTKHGAFFLRWYDAGYGAGDVKPMADDEARKWLEKRNADAAVIEYYFDKFPEAGAAESRITLRLPGNLYNRIFASATAANLSMNTYIMRLLERSEGPNIS